MGWIQVAIWIAAIVISYLLAPKPKSNNPAPGTFEAPTASEGSPIPVLFGRRWVRQANVVWYGDLLVQPIKAKGGKKG